MSELGREELLRLLKDSFGSSKLDLQAFQYDFPQEEFNNRMEKLNKAEEQIKALIQKPGVDKDWLPTAENINALPEAVRNYIADMQTNADPPSMVADNIILRDTVKALEIKLEEKPVVTKEWIQEKTMEMIEIISRGKILEAMSFIRKIVKEIS